MSIRYAVTQQSARESVGFLLDVKERADMAVTGHCARHDPIRYKKIQQISNQSNGWHDDEDSATLGELVTSDVPPDIADFCTPSKTKSALDDEISDESFLTPSKTKSNVSGIDDTSPSFSLASYPHPRAFRHLKDFHLLRTILTSHHLRQ